MIIPPIFDRDALLAAMAQGYQPEFLFFWGHEPRVAGQVGHECLSQWNAAGFVLDGASYLTAEHYMMAEKARLFGDMEAREKILRAGHPREAKSLGRDVRGFDEAVWSRHCFDIVVRGDTAKFRQNPALREFLSGTRERVLVEASPFDSIWGIGLKWDDPSAANPMEWKGLNLLGFALMKVRAEL